MRDAVLAAFHEFVAEYRPNDDGIAAADPERGRTASGHFLRETNNLILFGKLNHRASDRHALTLRYNLTDYSRVSDFVGEEPRRFVESHSTVGSFVSVVGESGVNELRVQYAHDDFGGCPSPTTSGSSSDPTRAANLDWEVTFPRGHNARFDRGVLRACRVRRRPLAPDRPDGSGASDGSAAAS